MKVLITGAAGWLGRKVTAQLEGDHEITLTDTVEPSEATIYDPTSPTGERKKAPLSPRWPYLKADLLDVDALGGIFDGVEAVVHLAAVPRGDWDRIGETLRTNVLGTSGLMDMARRHAVRRFVNASSINAYGTFYWRVSGLDPVRFQLPLSEDARPVPEDPYSLSKFLSEEVGFAYRRAFGLEVINLRFAAVWSTDRYQEHMTHGLPPTLEFPETLAQWIHEDDVVAGITLAVTAPAATPDPIVLAAADTTLPEPTLDILRKYRPELEPHLREPLAGRASLLSIERARARLGYAPAFSLDDAPLKRA